MFRLRLVLASALCSVACAQIAGFDRLSSHSSDGTSGGENSDAAGAPSIGGMSAVNAGHGSLAGAAGKSAGMAGHAGTGGNVSTEIGGTGAAAGGGGRTSGAGGIGGSTVVTGNAGNAGSAPTAGSAGAPVIGGCNAELLRNGDFEGGATSWRQESTAPGILEVADIIVKGGSPALAAAKVAPYAGNYLAWLGGVLDTDKGSRVNLLQDVQIPAKVSKLVLTGWIQIQSTEPDPAQTTDQLDLTLQDDQKYWSFHFWKGTEVTNGWKSFSYEFSDAERLDALRGRTLTFCAEAQADTSEITSYWLDSLSLFAQCPH